MFSRASIVIDLVMITFTLFIPALALSIYWAKQGLWRRHRFMQISLSIILIMTVVIFEYEVRVHGWMQHARSSPYWGWPISVVLVVHIVLAGISLFLWFYTLMHGLKHVRLPLLPSSDVLKLHRRHGLQAVVCMVLTILSAWLFYFLAFVA